MGAHECSNEELLRHIRECQDSIMNNYFKLDATFDESQKSEIIFMINYAKSWLKEYMEEAKSRCLLVNLQNGCYSFKA